MSNEFGELVKARRAELRLTLRECAMRARIDPGNLSRIERGRSAPPQDDAVLYRMLDALQWLDSDKTQHLRDMSATQNGRIPIDILADEKVMSAMPILLRTVANKQLDASQVDKLVEMIKNT